MTEQLKICSPNRVNDKLTELDVIEAKKIARQHVLETLKPHDCNLLNISLSTINKPELCKLLTNHIPPLALEPVSSLSSKLSSLSIGPSGASSGGAAQAGPSARAAQAGPSVAALAAQAPIVSYPVSGPVRYDKIIYQDKVIHNFGDVHNYNYSCEDKKSITMEKLLDATIAHHPDEIIDIFFEHGPLNVPDDGQSYVYHSTNYMSQLFSHYHLCFLNKNGKTGVHRTKACDEKYPNVRFHVIDFRQFIIQFLKTKTHARYDEYIMNMYYYGVDSVNLHEYIRIMFNNQYRAIEDKSIIIKLEKMYTDMIHKIQSIPFPKLFSNFSAYSTFILMTLMDIYLLARMFRRYDSDSPKFKNATPQKIIIYSGMFHTHTYTEFLKEIGGEVVMHSGSYEFFTFDTCLSYIDTNALIQCISIPVIKGTHSLSFHNEEPILLEEQLSKKVTLQKQTKPIIKSEYILPLSIPILKNKSPKQIDLPYSYFKRWIGTILTLIDIFRKKGITITEEYIDNGKYIYNGNKIGLNELKLKINSILYEIQTGYSSFGFLRFQFSLGSVLESMKNRLQKISTLNLKDFNELWDSVYNDTDLVNTSFDTLSLGIKRKNRRKSKRKSKRKTLPFDKSI